MSDNDVLSELTRVVADAASAKTPLRISGGESKSFLGCRFEGAPLNVGAHAGIVDYEPNELVITVRAGTRVDEIDHVLAQHNQMLGFEPPRHSPAATIGGTLACNMSGPARPWKGSVRDAVLGIRLLNGRGEHMKFGGRVIKNGAGFDVSRLQAGGFGSLGVITEVSLKVLPRPESTVTVVAELDARTAVLRMNEIAAGTAPVSAAAWYDGRMRIRLAGTHDAVEAAAKSIGGDRTDAAFWGELRDQSHDFFAALHTQPLWRLSVRSTTEALLDQEYLMVDWAGAQRFVRSDAGLEEMSSVAAAAGGHAMRMSHNDRQLEFLQQPAPAVRRLHERLKHTFDPARVLNPGRLYDWL